MANPIVLGGPKSYPNTLVVGDSVWALKFVRKIEGDTCLGICDPSTQSIYIRLKQSRKEIFSTLIHEVLHAIEFEGDFELNHKHIEKLERGIVEFILENQVALSSIMFEEQ